MASPLYSLALINAIVFGVQGNMQRRMNNPDSLTSHFIAGTVAGAAQTFVCSPMELVKTRLQVQGQGESRKASKDAKKLQHRYKGSVDCMKKIYRAEGLRGVFRGFWLTLVREAPSFGVYFVTYEYMCTHNWVQPDHPKQHVSTFVLLMAGGIAGMASWISTYPVDVIKSRIQADTSNRYSGFWHCCVKSYKEEGISVFGKGIGSTLLRAFPVNAATFAVVTLTLRSMRSKEEDINEINDHAVPLIEKIHH